MKFLSLLYPLNQASNLFIAHGVIYSCLQYYDKLSKIYTTLINDVALSSKENFRLSIFLFIASRLLQRNGFVRWIFTLLVEAY